MRHHNNIEFMSTAIDAKTGLAVLIGHPVEHSLSPLFMNYAMQRLELNCRYLAFDTKPDCLGDTIASMRTLGLKGINITIPHKNEAPKYVDDLDSDARKIGAVNCIYRKGEHLIGTNTDHSGFIHPLKERGYELNAIEVLLIGCGGAARGVVYALWNEGVRIIHLINRTRENAQKFITWCNKSLQDLDIAYIGNLRSIQNKATPECRLVINTTPVGMYPASDDCPLPEEFRLHKGQVVYDLVYNPETTMLLQRARNDGADVINGLPMLILQGIYSLSLWFPQKKDKIISLSNPVLEYTKRYFKGDREHG
ncbi:MAG: shikimate dehydrogenase [Spirochaetota bacterium]|nr:MAG: shikimate dehydrogenase [Spirochaetota bacterium]